MAGKAGKTVRTKLADAAEEDYELIRGALQEAIQAKKDVYVTCKGCGKKTPIQIPDAGARARAAEIWLEQGFGRPNNTNPEDTIDQLTAKDPLILEPHERKQLMQALEQRYPELTQRTALEG